MKIEEAVETLKKYYIENCHERSRYRRDVMSEKADEAIKITIKYVEASIRENTYIEEIIKEDRQ